MLKTVLILGSAVDAVRARAFDASSFHAIVAINNAWRIRDDWTHLVYPGDFPDERRPTPGPNQVCLSYETYVPANNAFGGVVYAGGTMAFSTAYWALHALQPDVMAFCGCDMIYDQKNGQSHFYGAGTADPLRQDPTLQSLEAKSNRLMILAAEQNCLCVNTSTLEKSRLTFPRMSANDLALAQAQTHSDTLSDMRRNSDNLAISTAKSLEADHKQFVPSGDYWNHKTHLNPAQLQNIDRQWLAGFAITETAATAEIN